MRKIIFTTTIILLLVSCTVTKQNKADNTSSRHTIDNSMQIAGVETVQTETQKNSKIKQDTISNSEQKNELKLTPEITEMVVTYIKNISDEFLSDFGIKNRSQLMRLQLGKAIPGYVIDNGNLKFTNLWQVPVMSDGEPLVLADVILTDNGQYMCVGSGGAMVAEYIHNYEHNDLIIGYLSIFNRMDYLYIRKDNKDIFVERYDYVTREWFKNEYSLRDIINSMKGKE